MHLRCSSSSWILLWFVPRESAAVCRLAVKRACGGTVVQIMSDA